MVCLLSTFLLFFFGKGQVVLIRNVNGRLKFRNSILGIFSAMSQTVHTCTQIYTIIKYISTQLFHIQRSKWKATKQERINHVYWELFDIRKRHIRLIYNNRLNIGLFSTNWWLVDNGIAYAVLLYKHMDKYIYFSLEMIRSIVHYIYLKHTKYTTLIN